VRCPKCFLGFPHIQQEQGVGVVVINPKVLGELPAHPP